MLAPPRHQWSFAPSMKMTVCAFFLWTLICVLLQESCSAEEECQKPDLNNITDSLNELLNAQQPNEVIRYQFTCLAAGWTYQLYRFASVVVTYQLNATMVTSQFEFSCNNTVWQYNSTSFRDVLPNSINLTTREDCSECNDVNKYACEGKDAIIVFIIYHSFVCSLFK